MSVISPSGNLVYEAKIWSPNDHCAPDVYSASVIECPPPNFIVSRFSDGTPSSFYGDLFWDWTTYNPLGHKKTFHFTAWCEDNPTARQLNITSEIQWFMFLLIWIRDGKPLAFDSLFVFMTLFSSLARYANDRKCRVDYVLSDRDRIEAFVAHAGDRMAKPLSSLLSIVAGLDFDVGSRLDTSNPTIKRLDSITRKYRADPKQVAPIPARIYFYVLTRLQDELNTFGELAPSFLELTTRCAKNPLLGRSHREQRRRMKLDGINTDTRKSCYKKLSFHPEFHELLDEHGLTDYFQIKRLARDTKGLTTGLVRIQAIAALQIHAYSGMRRSEVQSLTLSCDREPSNRARRRCVISGRTSKNESGFAKKGRWITSKEGLDAIRMAKEIAHAIYDVLGVDLTNDSEDTRKLPLFVSAGYLGFTRQPYSADDDAFLAGRLLSGVKSEFFEDLTLDINEEDIQELEFIDPHRGWRIEENYQVGSRWSLQSHQFRRSLSLYGRRSGLISMPSMKRQLHHITESLPFYYCRGSSFARDLMDQSGHFGREYQKGQVESESLAYIRHVLMSDEPLFGGHGVWLENNTNHVGNIVSETTRTKVFQQVERGELAYKETMMGGCTEPGPCDKRALRSTVGCLSCSRAIVKTRKLDLVIQAQAALVQELSDESVEWRTENQDLTELRAYREKCEAALGDHA